MKFLLVIIVALVTVHSVADTTEAQLFRRFRTRTTTTVISPSSYSSPQVAASTKAHQMASTGVFRHLGGGFGGGNAEGIGRGSTPQAALNNCCFTGQRPLLASSVVWSQRLRSYVAVKIFR